MCEFLEGFVHCICFIERFWICDIHRWGHGVQVHFDTGLDTDSWVRGMDEGTIKTPIPK
jgi:hypothetical protein